MSKGIVLFAHNNDAIDYVAQAVFCCKKIKEHLKLPVTLITSENVKEDIFDNVIKIENPNTKQTRNMYDGEIRKNVLWSNQSRSTVFDLTPYEETIVMDTDYIVENDTLLKAFQTKQDFLINYDAQHIDFKSKMTSEMKYISDTGIKMCWATVFYFKKLGRVKNLFTLIDHIKQHWSFYRFRYQLKELTYRNDFAFSIAIHIMNGFSQSDWPNKLPCKLFYITDRDKIISHKDSTWTFELQGGLKCYIKDLNIHVMNKIGLEKIIND